MLENILFSMNSTMPLFFIMLLGYVLHRTGFLSDAFVAGANKFVFYVALPVQLFRDLGKNDVRATFDGRYVLFCFAVTLACILVIWALAKLFLKSTGLVGEFVQVCYRSSAAILGSAFLQSIYGDASMSSLMILGSVPLYNIMAVVILMLEAPTAQAQTGNMAEKLKKSVKGILTNPILLGIAAGFAWSMLHISMPAMLDKALSNVAGLTSPLALLAIGAGFKGKKSSGIPQAYRCGYCGQADGAACAVPAAGCALWLYRRKAGGPAGDAGQHHHPGVLRYGKADGPRRCAYRQRVRYHHPVQRIQPDLLAVRAAEPRIYFITSFA